MAESNGDDVQSPPLAFEESPTIALMLQMQQQQQQQIQLQMQQQSAMQQQMAQLMSRILSTTNDEDIHQSPATRAQPPRPSRAKIERPKIDANCTDNQWVLFCDAWDRYKQMSSLTSEAEIRNELRSSCSPKVNELLFNFSGPDILKEASEGDLMKMIKSVAVTVVHPEVYRQQFYALRQSDGESVTNFVSRLKAQAMLCAFKCPSQECTTSHSSDMVKSQLIAGIRNPSHQDKVLSEMEILKTLDQVTNRLLALESTERATTHFRPPFSPAPDNMITPIGHEKRKPSTPKRTTNTKTCAGCGKALHPKGRTFCPAWGKTCNKCRKPNHFMNVCRGSANASIETAEEDPYDLSSIDIASF